MQEAFENVRPNTQSVKFIDNLIGQWVRQTGSEDIPHQAEEAIGNSSAQENTQHSLLQKRERFIQDLKRRLKESEEAVAFLSTSLETETRNKEEIRTKLSATWESIETITEYFNYISESLTGFHQQRINLSALYDNVILKQQEAIQKLQMSNIKSKDLDNHVTELKNALMLREEKLQEAIVERTKLYKQLENSEKELQLQKNELSTYTKEKQRFEQEQQHLLLENENLKSQLQATEKEKCDIAKSAAELENKLLRQTEKMQYISAETDKLQKRVEIAESMLHSQKDNLASTHAEEKKILIEEQQHLLLENENLKSQLQTIEKEKRDIAKSAAELENKLLHQTKKIQYISAETDKLQKQVEIAESKASTHAEEKKILIEEQQRLLSEYESLQSRMNVLEKDENDITEMVVQKDTLLSKLQDEILTYKDEIEIMRTNNNEISLKYETLSEKQNMWEKELHAKTEKIQNLEAILNQLRQRESKLINDVNRMEKKLTNEVNYSKDLGNKLSKAQENLQLAQKKNIEMQKTLEARKSTSELTNIELQKQLKVLEQEKEEIIKQENMKLQNTEIWYESEQAKHAEQMSALKSKYEAQLLELKKTIDSQNNMINDVRKENTALNKTLIKIRAENNDLKHDHKQTMQRSEDLQEKLKKTQEALEMKSIEHQQSKKEFTRSQPNIYALDDEPVFGVSPPRSVKENQKEQEAEVTSAGRKFFKSRVPGQLRTYSHKRR